MVIHMCGKTGVSLEFTLLDCIFRWCIDLDLNLAFRLVDLDFVYHGAPNSRFRTWSYREGEFTWIRAVLFDTDLVSAQIWCCLLTQYRNILAACTFNLP